MFVQPACVAEIPGSGSILEAVSEGSRVPNQFVHTSTSPEVALYYAEAFGKTSKHQIVEIDLDEFCGQIVDISDAKGCDRYGVQCGTKAYHFAVQHNVVMLQGYIQPSRIGKKALDTSELDLPGRMSFADFTDSLPETVQRELQAWRSGSQCICIDLGRGPPAMCDHDAVQDADRRDGEEDSLAIVMEVARTAMKQMDFMDPLVKMLREHNDGASTEDHKIRRSATQAILAIAKSLVQTLSSLSVRVTDDGYLRATKVSAYDTLSVASNASRGSGSLAARRVRRSTGKLSNLEIRELLNYWPTTTTPQKATPSDLKVALQAGGLADVQKRGKFPALVFV